MEIHIERSYQRIEEGQDGAVMEEKLEKIRSFDYVRMKSCGNIYELRYMQRQSESHIRKTDKDNYIDLITGEIKQFTHTTSRADNKTGVAKSLRKLRDILNTNITNVQNCRWMTLTYGENMRDTQRLYNDFRKFNMRLKSYVRRNEFPEYEYICAMEPQGRGAWHSHVVLIFQEKAPFLKNEDIKRLWGMGFVNIRKLQDADNVGLYLIAYLGDIALDEALDKELFKLNEINARKLKNVEQEQPDGERSTKAYIKGGRLPLYPPGFRIFRTSRGIKQPEITNCPYHKALEKMGENAKPTFESVMKLTDDDGKLINKIVYRHFKKAQNRHVQVNSSVCPQ